MSVHSPWQCWLLVDGGVEHQGGGAFRGGVCLPHDWQVILKDEGNQIKPSKACLPFPGTHSLHLSLTFPKSISQRPIIHWKLEPVRDNWLENDTVLLCKSLTPRNNIIRLWSHQGSTPVNRPVLSAPNHFLKVYQLETKPSMHESVWGTSYLNHDIKVIVNNLITLYHKP